MKSEGYNFLSKVSSVLLKHLTLTHAILTFTLIICTLLSMNVMYGQCSNSTQFSTTAIPCSGQVNSISAVPKSRFIKVNVIQGVNYIFTSTRNGITLRNDSNDGLIDHTTGTSISYTSTFSGLIKVYHCAVPNLTATLTFIANNTGSNTFDSQSSPGNNNWIGHLYKRLDNSTNIPPSDVNAFTSYIGYINRSEVFSEGFGGNTACFPTISNGNNVINTYTEFFAAKFYNQSVKPKGAYIISSLTSDDGIRMYVSGNLVLDRWVNQSPTTYPNILFSHSGNANLEMQYFESGGENVLNLGIMTRVNNLLTSNLNQSICEGNSATEISGTNVLTTAPINNTIGYVVTYQWQISSDSISFSNIVGATLQNYTHLLPTPGLYYIKRVATVTNTNPGTIFVSAVDESNVAQLLVNTKPSGTITGDVICEGEALANLNFVASTEPSLFSLVINGITYTNVSSGVAFSLIAPLVTTVYNLTTITDINGCINP